MPFLKSNTYRPATAHFTSYTRKTPPHKVKTLFSDIICILDVHLPQNGGNTHNAWTEWHKDVTASKYKARLEHLHYTVQCCWRYQHNSKAALLHELTHINFSTVHGMTSSTPLLWVCSLCFLLQSYSSTALTLIKKKKMLPVFTDDCCDGQQWVSPGNEQRRKASSSTCLMRKGK